MGKEIPHPLQYIKAVKYQVHEWIGKGNNIHQFFNDMEIEDFNDCPIPLEQMNLPSQMAVLMTEANQPYHATLLMPTDFRHSLVKMLMRKQMKEQQNNK